MPCCSRCAAHAAVGAVAIAIAPAATGAAVIAVPAAVGAAVAAAPAATTRVANAARAAGAAIVQSQLRNEYRHYCMRYRLFVPAPHVNKVPESSGTNSGLLISKRL